MDYFQQAIEKDPTQARAYAGLADCYSLLPEYLGRPAREAFPPAKAAARKALELDESLAEPHASLGLIHWNYDWDWAAAEREFQRALQLNPGYGTARRWYALFLVSQGRREQAIVEMKRALEIDPVYLHGAMATVYYLAHQYDKAIEHYRKLFEIHPDRVPAHFHLGRAYEQAGMYPEAIAELRQAIAVDPDKPRALAALAHAYVVSGRRSEALKVLQELEEQFNPTQMSSVHMAAVHVALGNGEQAFEWLERAYRERSTWLLYLKVDPVFESFRDDPRFQALLRRMNFPD